MKRSPINVTVARPVTDVELQRRGRDLLERVFGDEIKDDHNGAEHTTSWSHSGRVTLLSCSCGATFKASV